MVGGDRPTKQQPNACFLHYCRCYSSVRKKARYSKSSASMDGGESEMQCCHDGFAREEFLTLHNVSAPVVSRLDRQSDRGIRKTQRDDPYKCIHSK